MASIQYFPYLAILSYVDQSDEFRLGRLSHPQRHDVDAAAFKKANSEYLRTLQNRRASLHDASLDISRGTAVSGSSITIRDELLFNPYACLAFGHTDSWMFTLVDGIDPLFTLSQNSEISFEQLSLAFCPDLAKSGISTRQLGFFESPHEFIANCRDASAVVAKPFRQRIENTPLLTVTRFKLNGTIKLICGGDFTKALIQAIVKKVNDTVRKIFLNCKDATVETSFPDVEKWKSKPDDLPFRCMILDTQGVAELTIVMRCNNYALPTTLLHHLRSITLEELFRYNPSLKIKARRFQDHLGEVLPKAFGSQFSEDSANSYDQFDLAANHVFASTYTTACIDKASYLENSDCVKGFVETNIGFMVNPGHLTQVDKHCKHLTACSSSRRLLCNDYHRVRFGKFDLEHSVGSIDFPIVETRDFLTVSQDLYRTFQQNRGLVGETGILDLSCMLSVPIPRVLSQPDLDPRHFPITRMLTVISQSAGREKYTSCDDGKEFDLLSPSYRWFRRSQLERSLKACGVPKRLRDSFIYLFMNFFQCLNDPRLFDSILDLYDAFRTFHCLIVEYAEDAAKPILTPLELAEFEDYATALEDACYYRLCLTSPHNELNDMAVHFRGGLNALLAGADALLKAGIGVVKWRGTEYRESPLGRMNSRKRIGAITELCFAMQPKCVASELARQRGFGIAHLKINVGHVFHIGEFVFYMHEVGHLLHFLSGADQQAERQMIGSDATPAFASCAKLWSKEIFAEAFVFCYVCNCDEPLFLRQFLASSSMQPERFPGVDRVECDNRFLALQERLLVAFYAMALTDAAWQDVTTQTQMDNLLKTHLDRFFRTAENSLHTHSYTVEAFQNAEFWTVFRNACANVSVAIRDGLAGQIHQLSNDYHQYYCKLLNIDQTVLKDANAEVVQRLLQIDKAVDSELRTGKPLTGSFFEKQSLRGIERDEGKTVDFCDDPLLLACTSMIRCYLRRTICRDRVQSIDYHTHRDRDGKLQWPPQRSIAPFMVDQGFAGYFCLAKEDRAIAMSYATAVHKTLQSFSMELRRRRLVEMLNPNS